MVPIALLREAGDRIAELHLRNNKGVTPLESFEDGDIDYREIAAALNELKLKLLLVVELAYHAETVVPRPLKEDIRLSRIHARKLFGVP